MLAGLVFGVLSGFDRLMFRGPLRELAYPGGMNRYCNFNHVKLVQFGQHAEQLTAQLIEASLAQAKLLDRPIEYLASPKLRKEDHARSLAQRDGITEGLIAVFKCVEPCWSFTLRGNQATKKLHFRPELRKCLHLYHYYQHPQFGFLYARVQTWFPFTVQIGLNGREWLARQLDAAGLSYQRYDNCMTWVEDMAKAQALLDEQLRVRWAQQLQTLSTWVHPSQNNLLGKFRTDYYWSLKQSEWASDVLFAQPAELQKRYTTWLRFAMADLGSADILRFLGRKLTPQGKVNGRYADEVLSDLGSRVDGVRIKHQASRRREFDQDVRQGSGAGVACGDDDQRSERLQSLPRQGKRTGRPQRLAAVAGGSRGRASACPGESGGQRALPGELGSSRAYAAARRITGALGATGDGAWSKRPKGACVNAADRHGRSVAGNHSSA
jgi:hypothetical protein